jgi:hypothetical protein
MNKDAKMVKPMARKNNPTEKGVMENVLKESNAKMIFDKDEMAVIKDLAANNSDALRVVNDIILAHNNEKGYVMDILDELLKNDFTGNSLISLYENCDKDVELLIWNVESERLGMMRREDL